MSVEVEKRVAGMVNDWNRAPFEDHDEGDAERVMRVCPADLVTIIAENQRLRAKVTELQTNGSKLAVQRQSVSEVSTLETRTRRQRAVFAWVKRVFGGAVANHVGERALRLVEEAAEVAQSLEVPMELLEKVIARVYSREPGKVRSEIGGVSVTLLALSELVGVQVDAAETEEIERIFGLDEDVFRKKQAEKVAAGTAVG